MSQPPDWVPGRRGIVQKHSFGQLVFVSSPPRIPRRFSILRPEALRWVLALALVARCRGHSPLGTHRQRSRKSGSDIGLFSRGGAFVLPLWVASRRPFWCPRPRRNSPSQFGMFGMYRRRYTLLPRIRARWCRAERHWHLRPMSPTASPAFRPDSAWRVDRTAGETMRLWTSGSARKVPCLVVLLLSTIRPRLASVHFDAPAEQATLVSCSVVCHP